MENKKYETPEMTLYELKNRQNILCGTIEDDYDQQEPCVEE